MADEDDYLPITREISALMDRYSWFFEQLDRWTTREGHAERLLKVKRDAMNDYANFLLTLKHGRKQRWLDIQILNELHMEETKDTTIIVVSPYYPLPYDKFPAFDVSAPHQRSENRLLYSMRS